MSKITQDFTDFFAFSPFSKAVDYKVYQMWPPFLSLKILGLGRQVNWLYRPACVGRLCHSKYKMAATSDILYKSTALEQTFSFLFQFFVITIFTLENMHKIVVSLMLSLCTHVGSDVSHSG